MPNVNDIKIIEVVPKKLFI